MAKEKIIVGLDIGTTKIATIVAKIDDNKKDLEIIGVGISESFGMKKGMVTNLEAVTSAIEKSVSAAEEMAGVRINKVYAGIAGAHIKGINSRSAISVQRPDKEITKYDVSRVMEAAQTVSIPVDREIIYVLPQDFIVDEQCGISEPVGIAGNKLEAEVHIFIGAVTSIQNLIRCVNEAGIEVEEIAPEPLVSSYAVLNEDEKRLGVILADMGGGTTDIAIYVNGILRHTAVIPVGGDQITNDLSVGLRVPVSEAERIKKEYCKAMYFEEDKTDPVDIPCNGNQGERMFSQKELSFIIKPRLEEIFWLIHNEVRSSGFEGLTASGLVLTGGTSQMKNIDKLGEKIFSLPVRKGAPNTSIKGLHDLINNPIYSTGVGLIHYAWKKHCEDNSKNELNIFEKTFNKLGSLIKALP
ncbi:MAG: cell division protein FtsA [bacterium]|nr:cell division protein FtsA [bacterium]